MAAQDQPGRATRGAMATLRAYHPTLRDRAAIALLGDKSPNSTWGHLVGSVLGSTGVGTSGKFSPGDLMPWFQADEAGRQMASGHPFAGAANLAMALPLPVGKAAQAATSIAKSLAGRKAAEEAAQVAEKAAAPIIAYHGSPHAFDKFDTAKIGTGEGAQAYGHGLYFAENEKTAKAYRNQLSGYLVNGRDPNDGEAYAIQALDAAGGDPKRALAMHEAAKGQYPGWNSPEGQKTLEQWAEQGAPAITSPGHTYQVGINAHPDHFLDWDKPLSEQPAHVQAVLGDSPNETAGAKLSRAYRNPLYAGDIVGADKATPDELSAHLGAQGIPGIKYLDQGSRTAGDGTRNYVVFNPEHIDILKRYGIPATVMGGAGAAAAGAGADDKPDPAPTDDAPPPDTFARGGGVHSRLGRASRTALHQARGAGAFALVNHAPTEAQKRAGNYKKEHVSFQGLPIAIENKKGSIRSGVDERGKPWACELPADYGYIKGTEGADGDHVDVYIGPDPHSRQVFIVNQHDHQSGRFDEHKAVLGCHSEREAVDLYCRAFSDGKGRDRIGSVETVSLDAFKHWLANGRTHRIAKAKSIIDHAISLARTTKGPRHV